MWATRTSMETNGSTQPRKHHWSLTLLGIGLIVAFAYYGESVLAVLFFSILLSFALSPVVEFTCSWKPASFAAAARAAPNPR